jgi:hypothetical protein
LLAKAIKQVELEIGMLQSRAPCSTVGAVLRMRTMGIWLSQRLNETCVHVAASRSTLPVQSGVLFWRSAK